MEADGRYKESAYGRSLGWMGLQTSTDGDEDLQVVMSDEQGVVWEVGGMRGE